MSAEREPLPLAAARRRLGRSRGRPRTHPVEPLPVRNGCEAPAPAAGDEEQEKKKRQRRPSLEVVPRLLDIEASSRYMGGLCQRTVRGLIASGALPVVRVGWRVMLDVHDLDRYIAANKSVWTSEDRR